MRIYRCGSVVRGKKGEPLNISQIGWRIYLVSSLDIFSRCNPCDTDWQILSRFIQSQRLQSRSKVRAKELPVSSEKNENRSNVAEDSVAKQSFSWQCRFSFFFVTEYPSYTFLPSPIGLLQLGIEVAITGAALFLFLEIRHGGKR